MLCVGRGSSYPALSVAIGERVGLIGALSVETAARYLNARDIDGMVIGDGLGPRVVEALLTVLAEDVRFRDLPVGVLGNAGVDDERLPNLVRVEGDPARLVERLLPFVRLQAFEARLKRVLKSLETEGVIDPETGLLGAQAFWRDLDRAVQEAEDGGSALSVARFSFEDVTDRRAHVDAARLFSRLVRNIDFACRERGRLDPRRLHRDRSAQRPCGGAPHRQRAAADHARRPTATAAPSSRRSRSPRSSRPTISARWWRGSAPIPRLPPSERQA